MNVNLIDVMGTDLSVVNAARVSFAKESNEFSKQDAKGEPSYLEQYLRFRYF